MDMAVLIRGVVLPLLSFFIFSCGGEPVQKRSNQTNIKLEEIASSERQWTGVAVSETGRMFVNFPRWSENTTFSVGELIDGKVVAYPQTRWNTYSDEQPLSDSTFICVQSVFIDDQDRLWVLDAANPYMEGVTERGPRLYQFNISDDSVEQIFAFPDSLIASDSYLNDVRIDMERNKAYLTDSGSGGIYIVDLSSGEVMRRLEDHFSTSAETDQLMIGNYEFKGEVHSDGIALSNDADYLYYAALSGHSLYRVPVNTLIDPARSEREVGDAVTEAEEIVATDGMLFGPTNTLYLGGLEDNSIYVWKDDNPYHKLIEDDRIKWPDSFTGADDGTIYFTTSQIHLPVSERGSYKIYQLVQE